MEGGVEGRCTSYSPSFDRKLCARFLPFDDVTGLCSHRGLGEFQFLSLSCRYSPGGSLVLLSEDPVPDDGEKECCLWGDTVDDMDVAESGLDTCVRLTARTRSLAIEDEFGDG